MTPPTPGTPTLADAMRVWHRYALNLPYRRDGEPTKHQVEEVLNAQANAMAQLEAKGEADRRRRLKMLIAEISVYRAGLANIRDASIEETLVEMAAQALMDGERAAIAAGEEKP